ncbi:YCII-related domain protein [Rosistilla ulvae]|uniref:YCII-related domain protein n=1 Tax=Rosistilla ulvae TaxID=1930277 RepID=A0A517LZG2_9BACT|nr:YciI family protein [Rosistilla ulvae]QDS88013.1 YCII-related domain protein [Rosistilla ulvae]
MRFICFGYVDSSRFASMDAAEMEAMVQECFEYDDQLRAGVHFAGGEPLQEPNQGVTLRLHDDAVQVTDGPFAETKEQIGGILILEADNLQHAIELMTKHPGVRSGPFEIRPVDESIAAMIQQRNLTFQQLQKSE